MILTRLPICSKRRQLAQRVVDIDGARKWATLSVSGCARDAVQSIAANPEIGKAHLDRAPHFGRTKFNVEGVL